MGYFCHEVWTILTLDINHKQRCTFPRKAIVLCSRIVFWAVLLLDVGTQAAFLCYMSVKYNLKRYIDVFGVHVCIGFYVKQMRSIQFFNPSSVIHMGA